MRQWGRKWEITITWDRPWHSPLGISRYHTHVTTVRQLRQLVEYARRDPHVVSYRYGSVRVFEGEEPDRCRRGHSYGGGSANRVAVDYAQCLCGGHLLLRCRWPGCCDVLADPPIEASCSPAKPQLKGHSTD